MMLEVSFSVEVDFVCLPQLMMFVAQLKMIAQGLDDTSPAGR
jgi:hypothetical protein